MKRNGGRPFLIYLAGQGVSNLGDSFRFISVTILILKLTGSGMETALGLALSTLPSIIASPFAGVLGDRFDERRILILTDFVRFLTVPLFLLVDNVIQIYLLLVLLSLFDIFYNPSRRKFILGMTGREGALKANSMLTGVSGAAYLVGPLSAGFLTDAHGTAPAILTASVCCLCSCLLTVAASIGFIPVKRKKQPLATELGKGFEYCLSDPNIRSLLLIGLFVGFSTISVNLSFYPFAFDILNVTAKGWSLMITVYYGTNLVATLLLKLLGDHAGRIGGKLFYGGLLAVAVIWSLYAVVKVLGEVLLLQFIEGTVIAVCGILLAARFQTVTERGYMARVTGTNDIVSNIGRLAGMGCTALITARFSYGVVFLVNSMLLFFLAFAGMVFSRWARGSGNTGGSTAGMDWKGPGRSVRYRDQ